MGLFLTILHSIYTSIKQEYRELSMWLVDSELIVAHII